jgi:hypothetical protein
MEYRAHAAFAEDTEDLVWANGLPDLGGQAWGEPAPEHWRYREGQTARFDETRHVALVRQQRIDLGPELVIVPARIVQEGAAFGGRAREDFGDDALRPLETLVAHAAVPVGGLL